MAKCLNDAEHVVRSETINWAVYTTDDRFDDFSRMVRGMSDPDGRSDKRLNTARRLREGESVCAVRQDMPQEDHSVLDYLQTFERRLRRYAERRNSPAPAGTLNPPGLYDEFEIGILGESYDNLGMRKGPQPPASIPSHVTDAQLDDLISRATESINHRRLDQAVLDLAKLSASRWK